MLLLGFFQEERWTVPPHRTRIVSKVPSGDTESSLSEGPQSGNNGENGLTKCGLLSKFAANGNLRGYLTAHPRYLLNEVVQVCKSDWS